MKVVNCSDQTQYAMSSQVEFPQLFDCCAGIDVHKDNVVVTVKTDQSSDQTRTFSTFTEDLLNLKIWLQQQGVTHLAMESTGVYWKPVFNILEDAFHLMLVNARHIKYVPGHKTDCKDSAWIDKLLMSGLLKGSFIPPQQIREMRELYRYKKKLIGQRGAEKNRLQKILEDANIKLGSVVSDIYGKTGWAIICGIIEQQTDPVLLASMAKGSLKNKIPQLIAALTSKITDHHRFMLETSKLALESIQHQIDRIDRRLEEYIQLHTTEVELLETIPGVSHETATGIVSEVGFDMSVFPSPQHLASWAGICPGNNESAGKKKSSRVTPGNKTLKTVLVEAAWGASKMRESWFKKKYYVLAARRGKKRALIAIAHKLLIAVYHVLKNGVPYKQPDLKYLVTS
jgi:transposase